MIQGVSGKMAAMLGLQKVAVLSQKENILKKLFTFVPVDQAGQVRQALFNAGAGEIGQYSEVSFNTEGTGSFVAGEGANPFVGKPGEQHQEKEIRMEVILPAYLETRVVAAMLAAHPYEEVAYDLVPVSNTHRGIGSGVIGELAEAIDEKTFLSRLKEIFGLSVVRHTSLLNKPVKRVALCGGAGSFLISKALASGADAYITGDLKYHEFFDANDRMLIADIGHFESEQFTIHLLQELLEQKFPTFAVLKTAVKTNPVHYFL
jgi:hypothetical protein